MKFITPAEKTRATNLPTAPTIAGPTDPGKGSNPGPGNSGRSAHLRRAGVTLGAAALGLSLAALAAAPASATTHSPAAKAAAVEVEVKTVAKYGHILVDQKGLPLYYDSKNTPGHWACSKGCLTAWPPLLLGKGQESAEAGPGVKGLGTVKAPYGTQVTWKGRALYTFIEDSAGKVTGNDVAHFFVVALPKATNASGSPTTTTTVRPAPMTTTTVASAPVTTTTAAPPAMTTTTVPGGGVGY
jgi:predicted lipoprotein with Yx(FWY)xxD motif